MPQEQIKFGTDGWRAVIADDFTFENVRLASAAIASYILKNEDPAKGLVVAYDTRFQSGRFAQLVAETVAAAGIPVRLAHESTPTPALSYAVKNLGAAGGVVVTSSHNPWNWNGIKFKAKYGGSATPAIIAKIEGEFRAGAAPKAASAAKITETDFKQPYIEAITKFADLDLIAKARFKFAIDAMYGAGRGMLAGIFRERGIEFVEIRGEINPLFPGINPEPIEPHVKMLQETVVREKCHAGFVTDGDADRIGAVAEDGSFVDSHKVYSVLLRWLLERKKWPGEVVRAFNTTRMLDRIAARYGRRLHECGIGFKYICDLMLEREILIGGEESGGIGIPRHLPERDGILNSLLLAAVMAEENKTLAQLVADLQREYGPHYYGRLDLHIPDDMKTRAIGRASNGPQQLGHFKILRKDTIDGVKFYLDAPTNGNGAEAWVLLRASGTEPLLRIYSEAAAPELVKQILHDAENFVRN
ncbi:MAG TPA: phosphoglucomutase/phosphomannomutase family protein [Terriglobales bacterium]|jgi:phosphomannomutase|nr:phosphoglucomutase/phosphomannomutase family protein [Terriglobales bacterium]